MKITDSITVGDFHLLHRLKTFYIFSQYTEKTFTHS